MSASTETQKKPADPPSVQNTEVSVVDTFLEAINTGDLDRLLSCFSATSVITDAGRRIKGLRAITLWAQEEFLLPHGTLTAPDSRPVCGLTGDTVVEARISSAHHSGHSRIVITAIGDTIAYLKVRAGG